MGLLDFFGSKNKNRTVDWLEWPDEKAGDIVFLFPAEQKKIEIGARLTVREWQAAVVADEGKVTDVFEPGRYRLTARSMPGLAGSREGKGGIRKLFDAEVYFVNMRPFSGIAWDTRNPLTVRDGDSGPVQLRASGTFAFRVSDAGAFMKEILETNGIYETPYILGKLKSILVSELGETFGQYDLSELGDPDSEDAREELGERTEERLTDRLSLMGFELIWFKIDSISVLAGGGKTASVCLCGQPLAEGAAFCPYCGRKV